MDYTLQIENILFTVALVGYVIAMIGYFYTVASHSKKVAKLSRRIVQIAFVCHSAAIIARGIGAGRAPLSNQYEFATTFAWGIALFFLIFEGRYKHHAMGAFITPLLVVVIGYAALQNKEVRPLMPALQSGWLAVHVSLAVLSYGAFAVACGVSVMYLAKENNPKLSLPEPKQSDLISYRAVVLGYLTLTLTIITGAIWAQYSWGRFWAWDPKETWSLITWIIYTVYLHMRKSRDMRGRKAAWFLVIGFICVLFTYVGVNTLLPSLHSYA